MVSEGKKTLVTIYKPSSDKLKIQYDQYLALETRDFLHLIHMKGKANQINCEILKSEEINEFQWAINNRIVFCLV